MVEKKMTSTSKHQKKKTSKHHTLNPGLFTYEHPSFNDKSLKIH